MSKKIYHVVFALAAVSGLFMGAGLEVVLGIQGNPVTNAACSAVEMLHLPASNITVINVLAVLSFFLLIMCVFLTLLVGLLASIPGLSAFLGAILIGTGTPLVWGLTSLTLGLASILILPEPEVNLSLQGPQSYRVD